SVVQNAHQLQLLAMNLGSGKPVGTLSGNYTLGRSIDATATGSATSANTGGDVWGCSGGGAGTACRAGFVPIGGNGRGSAFTSAFDGGGSTISGLTINTSQLQAGLFGAVGSGGTVQNLILSGGTITSTATGPSSVGALAGSNLGTINHVQSTASVNESAGN